MAKDSVY